MTQEEKELLLKDLCARLPYHPHIWINEHLTNIELTPNSETYQYVMCEDCKPYLRPMSSMTEEEKLMYEWLMIGADNISYMLHVIDWLNAHHFDYRGLIEKGLAIEVTEENNPYK